MLVIGATDPADGPDVDAPGLVVVPDRDRRRDRAGGGAQRAGARAGRCGSARRPRCEPS